MKRLMWIGAPAFAAAAILGVPETTAQTQAPAQAQQCDQRARVIGHLAQKYKEAPVAIGVTSTGGMVEVLTTGDGGTWTIILSNPNGTSCLVAAGKDGAPSNSTDPPTIRRSSHPRTAATARRVEVKL